MKFLIINSVYGYGSTGEIVHNLAKKIISNGNECKVAYGRKKNKSIKDDIAHRITNDLDIVLNTIKARLFDNECFNAKRSTKKFISWIEEYNPDVIWLHNLHGYYINVEILFNWIKQQDNLKIIWTFHDCWPITGHCCLFSKCNKWKINCNNCESIRKYPKSYIADNSYKNFNNKKKLFTTIKKMEITVPSKWLYDRVKESYLKDMKVSILKNRINTNNFHYIKSNYKIEKHIENFKIVLGVASVWNKEKGLDIFIELSKMLPNNYKIILVGTNKSVDKKLPKNILSVHRTNNQNDLSIMYSLADVFVNPTFDEMFGLVNVESLACGTPVIVFNSGGAPETIDNTCGSIIKKGNIHDLIKEIIRVCENRPFSKENCIKRSKLFSIENDKDLDKYLLSINKN